MNKLPEWRRVPCDVEDLRCEGLEPAPLPSTKAGMVTKENGGRVEVTVPAAPFLYWIDTEGNIVPVPYRTTRVTKRRGTTHDGRPIWVSADSSGYAEQTAALHYAAGWLMYDTGAQGENLEAWLARRDKVIAERRETQRRASEESATTWVKSLQSDERAKAAAAEALSEFVRSVTDRKKAPPRE